MTKTTAQRIDTLDRLLADFAHLEAAHHAVKIGGLTLNSAQVKPGDVFFACQGSTQHGLRYAADAVARGAVAVVYETPADAPSLSVPLIAVENLSEKLGTIAARFYDEPSSKMKVVGITGTNGKTSCSQFVAQAMTRQQQPFGVIGTLGNGLWGALNTATHTTPDAISLHAEFARQREHGAVGVAMEVSSHALDQGRVNAVAFDIAVLTNLSRDHLDYHGDMAAYEAAKEKLFYSAGLTHAVVNLDDAMGARLARQLATHCDVIGYSREPVVMPGVRHIVLQMSARDQHGMTVRVQSDFGNGEFATPLLGEFNVSNLAAVLGVLLLCDVSFENALQELARMQAPCGRMERFGGGNKPLVVVDYAHTPDALQQSLATLRAHCAGQLWVVFGCGGDRDRGKRPLMGQIAEQLADRVVVTDDNPRTELPQTIVADIVAGFTQRNNIVIEHDRRRAIHLAVSRATRGDAVLVAGKGHEDYQIVGTTRLPFFDQDVVREALEAA